jgi:hypothetical protein
MKFKTIQRSGTHLSASSERFLCFFLSCLEIRPSPSTGAQNMREQVYA